MSTRHDRNLSLPNFICPGAQKAATTTLYAILDQHPDIFLPDCKETHFFDDDERYRRGREWYREQHFDDVKGAPLVGDITPKYMYVASVPGRLAETLGDDVKLIFMLRDPAERAYSHYWMRRGRGLESRSFQHAVEADVRQMRRRDKTVDMPGNAYPSDAYVERGYYGAQIDRFLEYFSREQMHFVIFRDFVTHMDEAIEDILDFLDVSRAPDLQTDLQKNASYRDRIPQIRELFYSQRLASSLRSLLPWSGVRARLVEARDRLFEAIQSFNKDPLEKPPMSRSVRRRLVDLFESDIERVHTLVEADVDHWTDRE